ncbi:hypothetical protein [Endozoicomonas atrinae]|uniref:hypothetical protein n=1 Tax=Endozoicomonas atrinae TaxID=1333660 RepID=UPI003AFF694E
MHQITAEQTIGEIRCYLAKKLENDSVEELGMTAQGRIVRLADSTDDTKELHGRLKEQLLNLQSSRQTQKSSNLQQHVVYRTLNEYVEITEIPSLKPIYTVSGVDLAELETDKEIRSKLAQLKQKYRSEFTELAKETSTKYLLGNCLTKSNKNNSLVNGNRCSFLNQFKRDEWLLIQNDKAGMSNRKSFFMINVVILQFEKTFETNGWLLTYPKTITRCNITNFETKELLKAYLDRYETDEFQDAFMKTDNGKSSFYLVRDMGMKIDKLTVTFDEMPEYRFSNNEAEHSCTRRRYSVVVHVSPNNKQKKTMDCN